MAAEILSEITSVGWKWPASGTARSTAGGVAHVELIGADGVTFRADAKQFALNGVDVVRRVRVS